MYYSVYIFSYCWPLIPSFSCHWPLIHDQYTSAWLAVVLDLYLGSQEDEWNRKAFKCTPTLTNLHVWIFWEEIDKLTFQRQQTQTGWQRRECWVPPQQRGQCFLLLCSDPEHHFLQQHKRITWTAHWASTITKYKQ